VSAFNGKATEEIRKALTTQPQHALVLDLRDNVGGPASEGRLSVMSSALSLVGRLTKGGQVATLVRRNKKEEPITATANTALGIKRIAVLINGGTSNVAELVAAALKEKAGATLVGSKSFGDGAYQKLVHLADGSAIAVNAGKLVTANGVDISTAGLAPDHPVAAGPAGADAALVKASELLATGN
jgi:carboxyl-terminal processing protease